MTVLSAAPIVPAAGSDLTTCPCGPREFGTSSICGTRSALVTLSLASCVDRSATSGTTASPFCGGTDGPGEPLPLPPVSALPPELVPLPEFVPLPELVPLPAFDPPLLPLVDPTFVPEPATEPEPPTSPEPPSESPLPPSACP